MDFANIAFAALSETIDYYTLETTKNQQQMP
jgi:hypothetical protein